MKSFPTLVLLSTLSLPSFAAMQTPQVAAAQTPKKEAAPVYDESADARKVVADALARAKKENRRVLIQWGANWCGWCKLLHARMTESQEVARKLMYEYDVVRVDVGHFDKNLDFAKELGAEFKGIPFLTILDADGKALVQQDTSPFETNVEGKQGHDPKKLVEFLTQYQAKYLDAAAVREAAFARAKAESKRVFLHFGAPWCGWCHRLEDWMARPEIATVLDKEFVDLKIDTDRMLGGGDMMKSLRTAAGLKEGGGIPWFVFFDAEGKALTHSEGPKGNTGFPYEEHEIAHFVTMLEQVRARLTPVDIATLQKSLTAIRVADEERKKAKAAGADSQ